ncbi:RNA-directed DNA polymerase-like protein [Cucumis melo var. makuwa]|uniref:RNA-directed DNA polymerase-like protein n=1 Tax=Cucumis melo var. makuwa TaxID=1194695 RepID=A0A5D3D5U6_CUCMM|nr:RNA-directed DNA polymerase-like protein [Cucumis melo var. makuwa]TYK18934.1 RNA-directed DNA polymerase-like protein [Cucumis melo var. makuwa]
MVDVTIGHEALSFLDGSSGYNQIRMAFSDEEMTAFKTLKGIYGYKVMPFGLKNVGSTYQRAMQKVFDDMLHKYVECYVNDLVVKSKRRQDHLKDLKIVFDHLRKYQLRMNPLKCTFGVTSEKFLGFIDGKIMLPIVSKCQEVNMTKSHLIDEEDWCQSIIEYLKHEKLPKDSRHKIEKGRINKSSKGSAYSRLWSTSIETKASILVEKNGLLLT